jgi:hypothetical protein
MTETLTEAIDASVVNTFPCCCCSAFPLLSNMAQKDHYWFRCYYNNQGGRSSDHYDNVVVVKLILASNSMIFRECTRPDNMVRAGADEESRMPHIHAYIRA